MRFSALVETTPEAYLASCMYRLSFLVGKGAGTWPYHPSPYNAEVKERVDLYQYPASAFMALYKFKFTLFSVIGNAGSVAHIGEKTRADTLFGRGKLKEKDHLEDLGIDGRLY